MCADRPEDQRLRPIISPLYDLGPVLMVPVRMTVAAPRQKFLRFLVRVMPHVERVGKDRVLQVSGGWNTW